MRAIGPLGWLGRLTSEAQRVDKRSKLPLGGAADLGGWLRGKRREVRGPPRPRARPRDGRLKRSMIDGGGEWLASPRVMRENSPPWASPPACRGMKFSRRSQGRGVGVERGAATPAAAPGSAPGTSPRGRGPARRPAPWPRWIGIREVPAIPSARDSWHSDAARPRVGRAAQHPEVRHPLRCHRSVLSPQVQGLPGLRTGSPELWPMGWGSTFVVA